MGEPANLQDVLGPGTALLFPELDGNATDILSPNIPHPDIRTLIVPDGTWRQTRRMVRRTPELASLSRFSIAKARRAPRVLKSPDPTAMSTLEAIALALGELGHGLAAANLLTVYDAFAEASLRQRGLAGRPF